MTRDMKSQKIWEDWKHKITESMKWPKIRDDREYDKQDKKYERMRNMRGQEMFYDKDYELTGNIRWRKIWDDKKYEMT